MACKWVVQMAEKKAENLVDLKAEMKAVLKVVLKADQSVALMAV